MRWLFYRRHFVTVLGGALLAAYLSLGTISTHAQETEPPPEQPWPEPPPSSDPAPPTAPEPPMDPVPPPEPPLSS